MTHEDDAHLSKEAKISASFENFAKNEKAVTVNSDPNVLLLTSTDIGHVFGTTTHFREYYVPLSDNHPPFRCSFRGGFKFDTETNSLEELTSILYDESGSTLLNFEVDANNRVASLEFNGIDSIKFTWKDNKIAIINVRARHQLPSQELLAPEVTPGNPVQMSFRQFYAVQDTHIFIYPNLNSKNPQADVIISKKIDGIETASYSCGIDEESGKMIVKRFEILNGEEAQLMDTISFNPVLNIQALREYFFPESLLANLHSTDPSLDVRWKQIGTIPESIEYEWIRSKFRIEYEKTLFKKALEEES